MKDLEPQLDHLRAIEARILLAEANIVAQQGVTDRLKAGGHPAQLAVELLDLMVRSLELLRDHQVLLLGELARSGRPADEVQLRPARAGSVLDGVNFEIRMETSVVRCFVAEDVLRDCFPEFQGDLLQCFQSNEWLIVCAATRRALKSTGSIVVVTGDAIKFEKRRHAD